MYIDDTKEVIRNRKPQNDRHYNDQKGLNADKQNTLPKTKD